MYNILIHQPAEGEGDRGKEESTFGKRAKHYVKPSASRRTRLVQQQAGLCMSSLRATPAAITAFHPDNYIDKQVYVDGLKTIKVAMALVVHGYD